MSFRNRQNITGIIAVVGLIWTVEATCAEKINPHPARSSAGPSTGEVSTSFERAGTLSCSGRGCHGSIDAPSGPKSREFHVWRRLDRHATAFDVLLLDRSRNIQKNRRQKMPADQDALCLKCHLGPAQDQTIRGEGIAAIGGVGCESCHGGAAKWLAPHSLAAWKSKSPSEKAELGMIDLTPPAARVASCVSCHVGDKTREVDHDLIAAGHPRLNFEASAFCAEMPKHWVEKSPISEADLWQAGQIETARAALNLLMVRAERAKDKAHGSQENVRQPWPEFAEFDCFACHHDLKRDGHARETGFVAAFGKRTPGAYPWGSWYLSMPRVLADGPDASAAKSIDALAKLMGKPRPDPKTVMETAESALKSLDSLNKSPALDRVSSRSKALSAANWDTAAQLYLALSALSARRSRDARPPCPRVAISASTRRPRRLSRRGTIQDALKQRNKPNSFSFPSD